MLCTVVTPVLDDDDFFGGGNTRSAKSSKLKPKTAKVSKLNLKRDKSKAHVEQRFSKTRLSSSRKNSKEKSSVENDSFWGDEDDDLFGDIHNSLSNTKKNSISSKTGSKRSSSKLRTSHRHENSKKSIMTASPTGSNDAWGDDSDDLFSSPQKVKQEKPAQAKTENVKESAGWGDEDDMFADLLSDTSLQKIPTKKKVKGGIKLKVSHNSASKQKQASKSGKSSFVKSKDKKKVKKKVELGDKDDFFGDFGF